MLNYLVILFKYQEKISGQNGAVLLLQAVVFCCDVAVAQINYPSFKHNTQDSIEQARDRSHEEDSSHIFLLDDM